MAAATAPVTAVVIGRYAGVVGVLADLLQGGGLVVRATAGLDADGAGALRAAAVTPGHDTVVVVTVGPGDPAADLALAAVPPSRVVVVTWHPPDERPTLPHGVRIVVAGQIRAALVQVVCAPRSGRDAQAACARPGAGLAGRHL